MDPTATLKEIRQLVRELQEPAGDGYDTEGKAEELAELVDGLDGWLSAGGFLPAQWQKTSGPKRH